MLQLDRYHGNYYNTVLRGRLERKGAIKFEPTVASEIAMPVCRLCSACVVMQQFNSMGMGMGTQESQRPRHDASLKETELPQ